MTKIIPIGVPVVKKKRIPMWKNRAIIEAIKEKIVRDHNKKIRAKREMEEMNRNAQKR